MRKTYFLIVLYTLSIFLVPLSFADDSSTSPCSLPEVDYTYNGCDIDLHDDGSLEACCAYEDNKGTSNEGEPVKVVCGGEPYKCKVVGFELPQEDVQIKKNEGKYWFFSRWLMVFGDPEYLVYFEKMPEGVDHAWELTGWDVLATMAFFGGTINFLTFGIPASKAWTEEVGTNVVKRLVKDPSEETIKIAKNMIKKAKFYKEDSIDYALDASTFSKMYASGKPFSALMHEVDDITARTYKNSIKGSVKKNIEKSLDDFVTTSEWKAGVKKSNFFDQASETFALTKGRTPTDIKDINWNSQFGKDLKEFIDGSAESWKIDSTKHVQDYLTDWLRNTGPYAGKSSDELVEAGLESKMQWIIKDDIIGDFYLADFSWKIKNTHGYITTFGEEVTEAEVKQLKDRIISDVGDATLEQKATKGEVKELLEKSGIDVLDDESSRIVGKLAVREIDTKLESRIFKEEIEQIAEQSGTKQLQELVEQSVKKEFDIPEVTKITKGMTDDDSWFFLQRLELRTFESPNKVSTIIERKQGLFLEARNDYEYVLQSFRTADLSEKKIAEYEADGTVTRIVESIQNARTKRLTGEIDPEAALGFKLKDDFIAAGKGGMEDIIEKSNGAGLDVFKYMTDEEYLAIAQKDYFGDAVFSLYSRSTIALNSVKPAARDNLYAMYERAYKVISTDEERKISEIGKNMLNSHGIRDYSSNKQKFVMGSVVLAGVTAYKLDNMFAARDVSKCGPNTLCLHKSGFMHLIENRNEIFSLKDKVKDYWVQLDVDYPVGADGGTRLYLASPCKTDLVVSKNDDCKCGKHADYDQVVGEWVYRKCITSYCESLSYSSTDTVRCRNLVSPDGTAPTRYPEFAEGEYVLGCGAKNCGINPMTDKDCKPTEKCKLVWDGFSSGNKCVEATTCTTGDLEIYERASSDVICHDGIIEYKEISRDDTEEDIKNKIEEKQNQFIFVNEDTEFVWPLGSGLNEGKPRDHCTFGPASLDCANDYPNRWDYVLVEIKPLNKQKDIIYQECTKNWLSRNVPSTLKIGGKKVDCIKVDVDEESAKNKYTDFSPNFCYESQDDFEDYGIFAVAGTELAVQSALFVVTGGKSVLAKPLITATIGFAGGFAVVIIEAEDKWPRGIN